ncbi:MAG TPA: tetratricopeptide repeat protein, partial [Planctomycetota bacterium]|nr:tetratricopeptide repeat protein [Planctomycetota bacterium]
RNNATVQFLLGQAYLRSRNLQQCMRCLARAAELEPGRLEVEFSLAQIRLALGQGDSAAAGLEKIVEKHPEHAAARLLLVQVHLQQKALPKAAAALKPMILSDGLNAHTLSMLLQTYESDADLLAWMTIADELLKSERVVRQADAHVLKGIVATLSTVTNDSLSRAEHHYKQALTLAPAHRIALHQKAINDLRTGRDDDATAALRKLDASQLAPDAHERMDLAVALLKIQAFSEARAVAFEEYALRRTPETLLALVAVELASGRHEEAAKLLEKTPQAGFELLALSRLARAPRASELFSKLAQSDLFARNKRESWALECLDQAQALAPESEDLAAIRAKALFTFGRKSDDAASALEKAFAADQKRADFAMLLADMRRAQNKLDEAVKLYRHVLESRPNEYRALVMAGTLLMNGSEKHAAADFLKQAIKLAPTDVVSLNNYVWLTAVEMNRPQAALPYAQDLARLAPDNPSALDTAGWVFHLNGQHEEAIKVLEYAALLAPESGDIAAHHALALHKAGRMKEAKTELERARQLKRSVVTEQDLQAATTVISAAN